MEEIFTYDEMDRLTEVKMGNDSLVYTYGYGHQRIAMEEHAGNTVRTKRYMGACEYVTETSGLFTLSKTLTYLSGPFGVFAVVERLNGGAEALHYVLKDHLGSWTTVTDSDGTLEQRLSYDAWGNLRDPNTWSGSFTGTPMFDRGFTGHEHLYNFGLINMNGRMYDPMMSSFLSADRFVQDPSSALGFNRYAYCMYNPLRYVDPTGWLPRQGTSGPHTSGQDFRDIYAYMERPYEPRDFRNPYYECNMSFYGSMGGLSGGAGSGGAYYGSYGYHVAYCSNSVYNYHFLSSMMALIQNWQNNPSRITGSDLLEAGISNLTVGELYGDYQGASGFRNSYYTWTDANGNKHTAKALYEYVGGNKYGVYAVSNQPLKMYNKRFSETINRKGYLPLAVEYNCAAMQLANYKMNYNVVVDAETSSIFVNANSFNTLVLDGTVIPYAKATLINNGQIIASKPLQYSGEAILNYPNACFVGSATFPLPSSGSIVLSISGGWNVSFYPCGCYIPTYNGFPIDADTTFTIY